MCTFVVISEGNATKVWKGCRRELGYWSGYIIGLSYGPMPNASRCGHAKSINDLEEEKKCGKRDMKSKLEKIKWI